MSRPSIALRTVLALVCMALNACGGGGGGGATTTPPPPTAPSMALLATTLSSSVRMDRFPGNGVIGVTVSGVPLSTQLYGAVTGTTNGFDSASLVRNSASSVDVLIHFKPQASLGLGTFHDTLNVYICLDNLCAQPLAGSGAVITTHYTITPAASVTIDGAPMAVTSIFTDVAGPSVTRDIQLADVAPADVNLQFTFSSTSFPTIDTVADTTTAKHFTVTFPAPADYGGDGTYTAQFGVEVCDDNHCPLTVPGSHVVINTSHRVTLPPLPPNTRAALAHDVIDAAYSVALDAIILLSTVPSAALYVYDPSTGTEASVALNHTPTALALAPDGAHAAVGHDGFISYVDLATVGTIGAPAPTELHTQLPVAEIVLDGAGYAHVFGAYPLGPFSRIGSVHIASDTETLGPITPRIVMVPAFAAAGPWIYGMDMGTADVTKLDIATGVASAASVVNLRTACGYVFVRPGSAELINGCGVVLQASAVPAQDLVAIGQLDLLPTSQTNNVVGAASESVARGELMVLRRGAPACGSIDPSVPGAPNATCISSVFLYDRSTLARTAMYAIPDVEISAVTYPQHGKFVFHSVDGSKRYLIGQAFGQPDPAAAFFVTTIP